MNCKLCNSTLDFEHEKNHFPNLLSCPLSSCEWHYEWRRSGLGGNLSREDVEAALGRCSSHQWRELWEGRMFIMPT